MKPKARPGVSQGVYDRLVAVLKACDNWNHCETCERKEKCILAWDAFCDKIGEYTTAQVEGASEKELAGV